MKTTKLNLAILMVIGLVMNGCQKQLVGEHDKAVSDVSVSAIGSGATQISGIGFYAVAGECESSSERADYILRLAGDFAGCVYTYVDAYDCSPGGTYREEGREHWVGTYQGGTGSFWTNYKFGGEV